MLAVAISRRNLLIFFVEQDVERPSFNSRKRWGEAQEGWLSGSWKQALKGVMLVLADKQSSDFVADCLHFFLQYFAFSE